jgi:hypothetical protein
MVIGGPAYNSQQLGKGDVILKVDGVFVTNENILETMIGCDIPGSVIELCVAKESAKELIFAYASNQLRHFY